MSAVLVVALVAWFFANISNAIQERDIPHGFEFLSQEYQTPIGEHFIPYESSDTFLYALVVAATNTIAVSVVGVVLATLLGIVVGVARLSGNWIVAKLAMIYVEFFRNVPLLVQLLFWFYVVLALPPVREGYAIAERLYINNGGVSLPWPSGTGLGVALLWVLLAVVAVIVGVGVYRLLARREVGTGRASYPILAGCVAAVTIGAMAWLAVGAASGEAPFVISSPEPQGQFGHISGGFTIRAGLLVLLFGLVIYTASFISEIVRAGIQSVGHAQTEAARAVGLSSMSILRHVTFPQALRVIIPPLISQSLNLADYAPHLLAPGHPQRHPRRRGAIHRPFQRHQPSVHHRYAGRGGGRPRVHPGQSEIPGQSSGAIRLRGAGLSGLHLRDVVR